MIDVRIKLLLPWDESLVSVLYHMLSSGSTHLSWYMGPFSSVTQKKFSHFQVFLFSPLAPLFVGVQMIKPSLSALFPSSEKLLLWYFKQFSGEFIPFISMVWRLRYNIHENLFFFGKPWLFFRWINTEFLHFVFNRDGLLEVKDFIQYLTLLFGEFLDFSFGN